MRIHILAIGKLKSGPIRSLLEKYEKRMTWSLRITEFEGKDESEQILSRVPETAVLWVLDERGESLSSCEFAKAIEKLELNGTSDLYFAIGGADGHSEKLRSRASKLISFGKATWPHMMVRAMIVEQIYRAQQILKGHPYHRG